MPYNKPRKQGSGYVLPKKSGGVHESASGKPVHYKSAAAAERAGSYIMYLEHSGKLPKHKKRMG